MAAPNEDTVVIVGGLGTQADKNSLNGGGATKVAWDAGSPSDFIGTNGGTITADTAVTYSNGTTTFSKTGIGTGVTVGTLAYVSGTNITAGIYEVTARTNDTIVCANIVAVGDNTDSVVNVGGALDTLQNALDNDVNNATLYNRYIYDNIATETIAATIDHDTNSGGVNSKLYIIGYNSTLAAEAEIIITTTTTLANGLVLIAGSIVDSTWENIDFNGGGKDSSRAAYCVNNTVNTARMHTFLACKFRGASSSGIQYAGYHLYLINCELYLNGLYGVLQSARNAFFAYGSSFHDNDHRGAYISAMDCQIIASLFYDNGKDGAGSGLYIRPAGDNTVIVGNTFYGNASDGLYLSSGSIRLVIFNNTSSGNGGYGYNITAPAVRFFGWNHSSVNTSGHTNKVADGSFADWMQGNNKADTTAAADIFVSVTDGSEDFTPKSGTDLIDNALDAGTA